MCLTRNQVYPQGYRGFDSLSVRHSTLSAPRPLLMAGQEDSNIIHSRGEIVFN